LPVSDSEPSAIPSRCSPTPRCGKPRPSESPTKLADARGLYLCVSPTGAKSWRYDYRIAGQRETLTIGLYDDVSLSSARERLSQARQLVAQGVSPAGQKKADRAAARFASENTVKAVAEGWYEGVSPYRSATWRDNVRRWLDQDVYRRWSDRTSDRIRRGGEQWRV
jgi:hypothetical protein